MKTCSKCGVEKALEQFGRQKGGRDGYRAQCNECRREYRQKNLEAIREKNRQYYAANTDRCREQSREYHHANREQRSEYGRRYYLANRDTIIARVGEYARTNAEEIRVYKRNHARVYGPKKRAMMAALPFEAVRIRDVAVRDGAHCWMCGDELCEYNPAHLDHLIPLAADPVVLSAWGVENPGSVLANYALACPSCNCRKYNRVMPCAVLRYIRHARECDTPAIAA